MGPSQTKYPHRLYSTSAMDLIGSGRNALALTQCQMQGLASKLESATKKNSTNAGSLGRLMPKVCIACSAQGSRMNAAMPMLTNFVWGSRLSVP
jgi:hypothetical protein